MTTTLTTEMFERHWPHADKALVAGLVKTAPAIFQKYQLTTPLRLAHFWGQVSWECNCGLEMIESLLYTHAQRIMAVWPSRFPTYASAVPYVKNPRLLADKVYNGRMGNRPGTDDGYDLRGHGLTQTTGRDAFIKIGTSCGLDLVNHPELCVDPDHTLEVGADDFVKICLCLAPADHDDVHEVTHRLNGGYEGLPERVSWTRVWKHEFQA